MNTGTLMRRAALCVALVAALVQARAGEARPTPNRLPLGTAFVVHPDGYLLTCYHVVKNPTADKAGKLQVMFGEGAKAVFHDATVVATDQKHDLALLRIQASGLAAIPLGNSDNARLQEEVLACGFPAGVTRTFTAVDGKVTSVHDLRKYDLKLIQSNIAANPGLSGGPLLNARGEAIGVVSFRQEFYPLISPDGKLTLRDAQNVCLAVAVNHARPLLRDVGPAAVTQPLSEVAKPTLKGDVLAERARPCVVWVCALSEGGGATPPPPPPTETPAPRPEFVKLEPVRVWSDHADPVRAVAFSPKGDLLASASDGRDHRVFLREPQTGKTRPPLIAPVGMGHARCIVFSSKGDLMVSCGGTMSSTACLWEPYTGKLLGELRLPFMQYIDSAAISPDTRTILTWSGSVLTVWDAEKRSIRLTLRDKKDSFSAIRGLAFLQGGEIMMSVHEKEYRLWHAQTWAQPTTVSLGEHVIGAAVSPDGERLALSRWAPTVVEVMEIKSGRIVWREPGGCLKEMNTVRALAFSPGGGLLAVGCDGREGGDVLILDAKDGTLLGGAGLKKQVYAVAFSPDGKLLATGDEGGNVGIWDLAKLTTGAQPAVVARPEGTVLLERVWAKQLHPGPVRIIAFRPPEGGLVASGGDGRDHRVLLWEARNGTVRNTLVAPASVGAKCDRVTGLGFSAKGDLLASVGQARGDPAVLWDPQSGQFLGALAQPGNERAYTGGATLSPDGRTLLTWHPRTDISGTEGNAFRVWDVQGKTLRLTLGDRGDIGRQASDPVVLAALLPGTGRILSIHRSDFRLWDPKTGALDSVSELGGGQVRLAALSPDGEKFAAYRHGSDESLYALELRAVNSGELLWRQPGAGLRQLDYVSWVAFSPDGKLVATGLGAGNGSRVVLWDAQTGAIRAAASVSSGADSIAFSPKGDILATGHEDGSVVVWDTSKLSGK
ncbi:MAG: trypsin-like serine protease [Planctomycetes bacterium]|nr:trypsin-like serine protease [Planctomycetota bacterium]